MVYQEKNNLIKVVMIVVISILLLTALIYIVTKITKDKEEEDNTMESNVNISEIQKENNPKEVLHPGIIPGREDPIAELIIETEEEKQEETALNDLSYCENKISLEKVKEMLVGSECTEIGTVNYSTALCNKNTNTWWIDVDADKVGCSPACVINVENSNVILSWRCTGLILE